MGRDERRDRLRVDAGMGDREAEKRAGAADQRHRLLAEGPQIRCARDVGERREVRCSIESGDHDRVCTS